MKRAIALADNCIDVYYKLDRYYLTGNSIDFALNYKEMGGDITEMTILGNDVFAMALEERLRERGIPLVAGLTCGHSLPTMSLPLGSGVLVQAGADGAVALKFSRIIGEGRAVVEIEIGEERK